MNLDLESLLELNRLEDMEIHHKVVGSDNIPVLVVDNFLRYPDAVREFALQLHFDKPLLGDLWPGLQAIASLHRTDVEQFIKSQYLEPVLGLDCRNYDFPPVRPGEQADQWSSWFLLTRFGVITMPFDEAPWAKNPHVDYFGFIASVIYLSLPHQSRGGTVFIRHRETGVETIPPPVSDLPEVLCERLRATHSYSVICEKIFDNPKFCIDTQKPKRSESRGQVIDKETYRAVWQLITDGNVPTYGYLTKSNEVWEVTDQVDVKFNRLVLYPTWHLHSVSWDPSWYGSTLPERRLTMMNWMNFPVRRSEN
ncbi:DUF6445 family protein [Photorhabdus antumapuensis]|uniref:DUF6445 family protein n=1 Tax=Photorhabdus antumapuensis TaxID=2862867 RepID=UPI001CEC51EE|nr:DUF6445 family protein [Photorhabdus antumapuensis]MCA6221504.1 hypothetical protein [Photorhabdus antumapuensis]